MRDHGPGIDPADLPHIFDRFYRSAAARTMPGSGLGLAIVKQSPVRADAARSGAPLMLIDSSLAPRGWCGGVPTGHRLT